MFHIYNQNHHRRVQFDHLSLLGGQTHAGQGEFRSFHPQLPGCSSLALLLNAPQSVARVASRREGSSFLAKFRWNSSKTSHADLRQTSSWHYFLHHSPFTLHSSLFSGLHSTSCVLVAGLRVMSLCYHLHP